MENLRQPIECVFCDKTNGAETSYSWQWTDFKAGLSQAVRVEQGLVGTLSHHPEAVRCRISKPLHRERSLGSIPASCAFVHRSFRPASSDRRGGRPGARSVALEASFRAAIAPMSSTRRPSCGCVRRRTSSLAISSGAVIENRDDGASRIERDGQSWITVRGDAEDDHDHARSGDLPASALPHRSERGIKR